MKGRFRVALGFLALILAGAIALAAPFARTAGVWGGYGDALFTACSAVCVTGLTVTDIAATFTRAGQIVILALVELGCLGLMTCGTFLMVAIGRRLSLSREFSLMNAYGVAEVRGLKGLACWVIGSTFLVEAAGAALLRWRLGDTYRAVFYAVMSFCNAGFSIDPGSLAALSGDSVVILTLAFETILGGIGFLVLYNLCTCRFLRGKGAHGRLSLHTKVVLRVTLWLLAIAFVAFLAVEWRNVLQPFAGAKKLLVAFYQAVTPRTCGFSIVPTEALRPVTRLLYAALMFIGGGPGSAAAGIKVTTFAVLFYTLRAMCRGEQETVIGRRTVTYDIVRESLVIMVALMTLALATAAALLLTEQGGTQTVEELFFEAVSAITTTGLSMGQTTTSLSLPGRAVIMLAMFLGRLGALTVVMMIGDRETPRHVRYPQEELVVG